MINILRYIFIDNGLSQIGLLQAARSWANAGVLLGTHVRRRVVSKQLNYRDEVSERSPTLTGILVLA